MRMTLTISDCVIDGDGGLARFPQHGVHWHPQHKVKGLRSLKLRLTQIIQDGHSERLHRHSGCKVKVAADANVVQPGCWEDTRNNEPTPRCKVKTKARQTASLPSAETGSLFLERTVTVAVLERSVPVLHTFTST